MENNVRIQFKGISRTPSDTMAGDGEMMEMVNARISAAGTVEPVGVPELVKETVNTYKEIYHHSIVDRYIGITQEGYLYEIAEDFSSENLIYSSTPVTKLNFIGKTVSALTEEGIIYFLYKNGYKYLGPLPELPEIEIGKEYSETVATSRSESAYTYGRTATDEENKTYYEALYGLLSKSVSELNKDGYFVHAVLIRIAYKLFDGQYVKHSPIRLIFLDDSNTKGYTVRFDTSSSIRNIEFSGSKDMQVFGEHDMNGGPVTDKYTEKIIACVMGFRPTFTVSSVEGLSVWSDIISDIEVFSTPSIIDWYNFASQADIDIDTPVNQIKRSSLFYELARISLSGEISYEKNDVSSDIIATRTELTDDSGTHNQIIPENSYTYNNRLHVYEYDQVIFDGYNKDYLYDCKSSNYANGQIEVATYIHASDGDKVLRRSFTGVSIPDYFPAFLMYPDYRAYKMVITCNFNGNVRSESYTLYAHDMLNLSYSLNVEDTYKRNPEKDDIEEWSTLPILVVGNNSPEHYGNVLKVSNVNNPFFFPSDQTYSFDEDIVGIQSNVIALSQGQFGQFPLYVFTKGGIYSMQVGSGTIAYSTVTPVSRDVCNNPDSICGLDSMVAFATVKGLMVISGSHTEVISLPVNGFISPVTSVSPIVRSIIDIAGLGTMTEERFEDYLSDSRVGYNYRENEVMVSRSDREYIWVYAMQSACWYRRYVSADRFINAYPETLALSGRNVYRMDNRRRSVNSMVMVTRPMKIGTVSFKRVSSFALRCTLFMQQSDSYISGESVSGREEDMFNGAGMYLLGSMDGMNYTLVAKKERIRDIRDMVSRFVRSRSYRYFIFAFVGGVRTDVSMDFLELMASESFSNRLR